MTTIQAKGKRAGTPNYKNEILLNLIEYYLPAGTEQWKIVAQRYQEMSKEVNLRDHDDIKRHFNDKLCKKNQRQTGINNKSGPLPLVAKAQDIQRKILINEATISVGGDNENDACDDEDNEEDDEEDDFGPSDIAENVDDAPAVVATSDVRPKKKIKVEDGQKTKNSRPCNPRGGIQGSIAELASNIGSNQSLGLVISMMQQQQQQFQQQQNQQNQQMMMMMMMVVNGRTPTIATPFATATSSVYSDCTSSGNSSSLRHDISDLSDV